MDTPPANTVYGPDDPVQNGPVAWPETYLFPAAFRPAFIAVNTIGDPAVSESNLPFALDAHDHPGFDSRDDMVAYGAAHRQTPEDIDYWSVYVVGIYEYGNVLWNGFYGQSTLSIYDNDDDSEFGLTGATVLEEPEYSFIPMEIISDVAGQTTPAGRQAWTLQQQLQFEAVVTLHEVGHQFELGHSPVYPSDVMSAPPQPLDRYEPQLLQVQTQFRDEDIGKIRTVAKARSAGP